MKGYKKVKYFDELKRSMEMLVTEPNVLFLGQAVGCDGTGMTNTLKDIDISKRIELPVTEEMQLGMCTGMALNGFIPVSIFPRWNFLLLAVNQLVNHLDKLEEMSKGGYKPGVIIRTGIGSERPLHPQSQHVGDFTDAFRLMLKHTEVIRLDEPKQIFPAYELALARAKEGKATVVVEWSDYYNEK